MENSSRRMQLNTGKLKKYKLKVQGTETKKPKPNVTMGYN